MKSLSLTKPHVIVMVGIPGSGKSFFAEKFADTFRAPFVSLEKLAVLTGITPEAVRPATDYQLGELLKTNQSIIIEGIGDTRVDRMELAKKARTAGYETLIIWVQTDPATAKARATKEGGEYVISADDFDKAVKRFTPPTATEKPVVISGKHTYASQAKVVLKKLSAPRAEISAHTTAPVRDTPSRRSITIR